MSGRVAYLVRSWPRLSQTFIVNEVKGLEQLGVELEIFAMVDADEPLAAAQGVRAPVRYLEAARRRGVLGRVGDHVQALAAAPVRYLTTVGLVAAGPHLAAGYSTASRWTCFSHAVHVANACRRRPVDRVHAHFAHDPALIALLVHRLTGAPFSVTAHARDLYGIPARTLRARTDAAVDVVTCCRANADYLRDVAACDSVHLVHHGVDVERFQPRPHDGVGPLHLLSVGRLVEKKGFDVLLAACARLRDAGHAFRCTVYGDGPLRAELTSRRDDLGLAEHVRFAGAAAPDALVPIFQQADVFVLTPVIGADGDRDGIPNALVEAMACGVPVVSTTVGGIPELITDGRDGLLAPPHDPTAVADHLATLLGDADRRRALGASARSTVESRFDARAAARQIATLFGATGKEASCASLR